MPEPKFPGARIEAFKPVDVTKFGKKEVEDGKSHEIKASHTKVVLDKANEGKFPDCGTDFAGHETIYIGGDVENVESGVRERYDVSHVELPDGTMKVKKVESVFTYPDGRKEIETLEREYDEQGRVIKEVDRLDGKVVEEIIRKYDGKLVSEYSDKRFDDDGAAVWGQQNIIDGENIKTTYIELGRKQEVFYSERRSSTHDARPYSLLCMKRSTMGNNSCGRSL